MDSGEVTMRFWRIGLCLYTAALALWAQSDRGTITGAISDPAGAVIANAAIGGEECRDWRSLPIRQFGNRQLHDRSITSRGL